MSGKKNRHNFNISFNWGNSLDALQTKMLQIQENVLYR